MNSAAEPKYLQMHKEAQALVFGLKKAHFYLPVRHFKIHTDHKPLLAIFKPKSCFPIYSATRFQSCGTIVPFGLGIEYVNKVNFGYADVISQVISNRISKNDYSSICCYAI